MKVSDGFHLWTETYDRTLDDIFAVQDDIAQSVVRELRTALLGEVADSKASGEVRVEVAQAAKGRGRNAEAHRLFLQGRFLVLRWTPADTMLGVEHFHRALAIDPEYAAAWASLSWAETYRAIVGHVELDPAIVRAREAVARALALEPDLPEGHLALGTIRHWYDFDWKGAEASYRRALEFAPSNADVIRSLGTLAGQLGRIDEGIELGLRAIDLDPLTVVGYGSLARTYRRARRHPEAEAAFRKVLEISPEATAGWMQLGLVVMALGRYEEALEIIQHEKSDWARMCALAMVHHRLHRREESDAALRELIEHHATDSAFQVAGVYAVRGEVDQAFEWLERAYAQHDSGLTSLKGFVELEPLSGDPRWQPFVRKMGLAD